MGSARPSSRNMQARHCCSGVAPWQKFQAPCQQDNPDAHALSPAHNSELICHRLRQRWTSA
eukprot:12875803-Prorocentrum_lima.AAC.1